MNAPTHLPTLMDALPGEAADAPHGLFTRARQVEFLHALADCGAVRNASARIGVSYRTVYRERRANAAFRRAWDAALLSARALSEDVLACRALDGVEEVVWFRGEEVGRRVRYDSRLLLAHLARLDKLTEDARTRAFADDYEGALERFAAGIDDPAPVCSDCGEALPWVGSEPIFADPELHRSKHTPAHPELVEGSQGHGGDTVLRQAQHERDGAKAQVERASAGSAPTAPARFTPGHCDNCDMPSAKARAERAARRAVEAAFAPCPDCGGGCLGEEAELTPADCMWLGNRLARMDRARPRGARKPHQFPSGDSDGAIEAEQLAAFEDGAERWWLVVPPAPGAPEGEWAYFDE